MMEWREFGSCYRISKCGIVESNYSGEWKVKKRKKSKSDNKGGFYITVNISGKHTRVHLLMWEVWKGPRIKGLVINHIDGNRENCALDNLEEITQKKNIENLINRGNFKGFGRIYVRESRDIGSLPELPGVIGTTEGEQAGGSFPIHSISTLSSGMEVEAS